MQGIVTHIKHHGVIATLDGTPEIGDLFEIYRIENGEDVILAKGYVRKEKGVGYNISVMDKEDGSRGIPWVGILVGDLVRTAT